MKRMRSAVRERVAVVDVDRECFHAAGIDELGDRANQALPLVLALVAAARRKQDHRRPPVAVDDDAHVAADTVGVPAVVFAMHKARLKGSPSTKERQARPLSKEREPFRRARSI